jgi:hypothetical protein
MFERDLVWRHDIRQKDTLAERHPQERSSVIAVCSVVLGIIVMLGVIQLDVLPSTKCPAECYSGESHSGEVFWVSAILLSIMPVS